MITNNDYPIDVAYHAIHQHLMMMVYGAREKSDSKMMWRSARSLLAVERMMGTKLRFAESMRLVALGKGARSKRRALGDISVIINAHEHAMCSIPDGTIVEKRARVMINNSLMCLMPHARTEKCAVRGKVVELFDTCDSNAEQVAA